MITLGDIAKKLGASLDATHKNLSVSKISSLELADKECISFVNAKKMIDDATASKAVAFIVSEGIYIDGKINLTVKDAYLGYALVAQMFEDITPVFGANIHTSSIIDDSSNIDNTVSVGPLTVIGKNCSVASSTIISASTVIENNVTIGKNCRIDSGVIIRSGTKIGDNVIIQSGTVIGAEGFGNAFSDGKFTRIPCFGDVVIEDNVEIGACVTIDRGNFISTTIKSGSRIDNLVMIAHNVIIGNNSAMAAQVGISGSTIIGNNVILGGQAGLAGHLKIGDRAFVGAQGGVTKSVEPDAKVAGYPARDLMQMRRVEATQMKLPQMKKDLKRLTKEVDELKKLITK